MSDKKIEELSRRIEELTKENNALKKQLSKESEFKQKENELKLKEEELNKRENLLNNKEKELLKREEERGDRCVGSAEASFTYLYPKEGYDVEVDTGNLSSSEAAQKIFDTLFTK